MWYFMKGICHGFSNNAFPICIAKLKKSVLWENIDDKVGKNDHILPFHLFSHFLLLFNYSCPHYPPITLLHPIYPHLTLSVLSHSVVFVRGSFIHVPLSPFPFFPLLSPSNLPSGHCQFVLYFHVSGSILLTCLFCWLGSTYRWDHIVFVFYHLAYFIYIMLSSSIHAVPKGRSSFFLSAA